MKESSDDLSEEILRQKLIATRNHYGGKYVAWVGTPILLLYLACSAETNDAIRGGISGLILLLMLAVAWATQRGKAKCPKCNFDWEIKEDESGRGISVLNWNCCPGCGLKMPNSTR